MSLGIPTGIQKLRESLDLDPSEICKQDNSISTYIILNMHKNVYRLRKYSAIKFLLNVKMWK